MNHVLHGAIIALLVACGALWQSTSYYRSNAITYKEQRDEAKTKLSQANATITDLQQRHRDVAALDEKYSKELADAKAENDALRNDIAAGRRRLRIRAVCPSVREASTSSGVDDAASPGLTDAAQRDYFVLRERIATSEKMIRGLQEYIRDQCIK